MKEHKQSVFVKLDRPVRDWLKQKADAMGMGMSGYIRSELMKLYNKEKPVTTISLAEISEEAKTNRIKFHIDKIKERRLAE